MTRLIDCQSGRWLNKVVVNHTSSGRSGNGKQKCPRATFETFRMATVAIGLLRGQCGSRLRPGHTTWLRQSSALRPCCSVNVTVRLAKSLCQQAEDSSLSVRWRDRHCLSKIRPPGHRLWLSLSLLWRTDGNSVAEYNLPSVWWFLEPHVLSDSPAVI